MEQVESVIQETSQRWGCELQKKTQREIHYLCQAPPSPTANVGVRKQPLYTYYRDKYSESEETPLMKAQMGKERKTLWKQVDNTTSR